MIATAFGTLRVCDAHTHFLPRSFFSGLGRQLGLGDDAASEVARRLGWDMPQEPSELAARWVAEMDRHGVDRMVSIHTLPGDVDSTGQGIRAAAGRLAGYVMVNPPNAEMRPRQPRGKKVESVPKSTRLGPSTRTAWARTCAGLGEPSRYLAHPAPRRLRAAVDDL